jgi:hypothetical protein
MIATIATAPTVPYKSINILCIYLTRIFALIVIVENENKESKELIVTNPSQFPETRLVGHSIIPSLSLYIAID